MLKTDNRFKLATGFLILVTLTITGYSGFNLSQLYEAPLVVASPESKQAKEKWDRLQEINSGINHTEWDKAADLLVKTEDEPPQKIITETKTPDQVTDKPVQYRTETLPVISGIILSSDSSGDSNASVLINNTIYKKNREVTGYMITGITESSITLTKNGRHYKVDAPTVPYSVDQGE